MPHIHELIDFTASAYIVFREQVLLIKHKKYGEKWLPVAGHIELDEDPEVALFREISEESGILRAQLELYQTIKSPRLDNDVFRSLPVPIYFNIHQISTTHRHVDLVYFLKSQTDKVKLATDEHLDIKWYDKRELETLNNLIDNVKFYALEAIRILS